MLRVREVILEMLEQEAACYLDVLRPRLADQGVHLSTWSDLSQEQRDEASAVFDTEVSPVLTPLGLDAAHPFPYISNLSTSWAFRLADPASGESVLVRVKVPRELPQWLRVRAGVTSPERVFVETRRARLGKRAQAVPGNGDRERGPHQGVPRRRGRGRRGRRRPEQARARRAGASLRRFEPVVRLEVQPDADPAMVAESMERFGLGPEDVYEMPALLDYTTLFEIAGLQLEACASHAGRR